MISGQVTAAGTSPCLSSQNGSAFHLNKARSGHHSEGSVTHVVCGLRCFPHLIRVICLLLLTKIFPKKIHTNT